MLQLTLPITGLSDPYGIAVDSFGNIYIADSGIVKIVKYDTSGQQTNLQITGLSAPYGVAVDSFGNIYIADAGTDNIVKYDTSGTQKTLLITGLYSPSGIAVDSFGNIYIVDSGNSRIVKYDTSGQQTTLQITELYSPNGIAVDSFGNIYITDTGNSRIVKYDTSGTQTTLPITGLSVPYGVAVDSFGNIYVCDNGNNCIFEILNTISAPPNSLLNLLGFVNQQSISASTPAQNSYVFPFDDYVNIWIENVGISSQEPQQITYKIPIQSGTTYWTNNNVNRQIVNNQNAVFPFSRMNISVFDKFGNLLNNNGQDWSFTIKVPDLIHLDTSATNATKIDGNPFQVSIPLPVFYKNVNRVELVSAEIPSGFYNIRSPFNTFVVGGITYTVPPGNYTISSLLSTMSSLISATSLGFATINNKIYLGFVPVISNPGPQTISTTTGASTLPLSLSQGHATSWALSPALPTQAGGATATFNTSTGTFNFSQYAYVPSQNYTVTATNAFGTSAPISFTLVAIYQSRKIFYNPGTDSASPYGTIYNPVVPASGYYSILLAGAGITTTLGGTTRSRTITGNGAILYFARVYLNANDALSIIVGKQGAIYDNGAYVNSGGCGGTFISNNTVSLFVAGGAGGIGVDNTIPPYIDACGLTNGRGESLGQWSAFAGSTGYNGTPGSGGNGAQQMDTSVSSTYIAGGGGGGYSSNSFSSNFTQTTSARGFVQGGAGEVRGTRSGGFGGGGAGGGDGSGSGSFPGGGGGGGYNGGQGAITGGHGTYGGGGSSYYDSTTYTPTSISFTNTGAGYVTVAFQSFT